MNKKQKIVQQQFLNDEEAVIKLLKGTYQKSLVEITKKAKKLQKEFEDLQAQYDQIDDEDKKEQLKSMQRSKIYQKQYQEALKKQVSDVLDKMNKHEFKTVSDYLDKCYSEGFLGTMYDLHGQGIPLIIPIDQEAMVQAVQLDSKISKGLYQKLGEDVADLKKRIAATVSRGISSGLTFQQLAQQLAGQTNIGYNRAVRITRTEGHRIQVQSAMNASYDAKDLGADVLKQWDATLDGRTRESHREVDGEIRELDEPFSNGLMFPGDPSGGASEVIFCRCALLQRARWALDEAELETLKERAAFFGLDKAASFDDFKAKYIDAVAAPAAKPKKEYLTKKKLEQKLSDGQKQMEVLEQKFHVVSGGLSYDEIINQYGSLDGYLKGQSLNKLESLKDQMDDLKKNMDDWQEKLEKKIVAAETKKLKKEQILLQDEIDQFDVKTYNGIWKNDVTTADWPNLNIAGKKQYYEGKFITETDPVKLKEFHDLYDQLLELDDEGQKYYDLMQKMAKNKAALQNVGNSGKIGAKVLDDAFTQDRKDAALWAKTPKKADDQLRSVSGDVWQQANQQERYAIYDYTCGSGKFNRPLSGFEKPYAEYGSGWEPKFNKGVGNVWIDYEGAGDEIRHMTNIISRSSYDIDVWLQRGCGGNAMESFLGLTPDTFTRMSNSDLQQFVGRSNRMYSFTSCGVAKGKGFSGDCILNIYAPKGTQMMYAEPFSRFGNGSGLNWNGISPQSTFGYEAEMIIQRGASYTITKVEKSGGTIYIDMEVHPEAGYDLIQQDPAEWKGSKKKGR